MPGLGPAPRCCIAQPEEIVESHGPKPLLAGTQFRGERFERIKNRGRFMAVIQADARAFAIEKQIELHCVGPALLVDLSGQRVAATPCFRPSGPADDLERRSPGRRRCRARV